jgi:hypothetical protein
VALNGGLEHRRTVRLQFGLHAFETRDGCVEAGDIRVHGLDDPLLLAAWRNAQLVLGQLLAREVGDCRPGELPRQSAG